MQQNIHPTGRPSPIPIPYNQNESERCLGFMKKTNKVRNRREDESNSAVREILDLQIDQGMTRGNSKGRKSQKQG